MKTPHNLQCNLFFQKVLKKEKIKLALEKMKEASIKKLYVKFFTSDGGSKSLLVDERSTVAYVLRQLSDKHRLSCNANFALVEHYPDLYMGKFEKIRLYNQNVNGPEYVVSIHLTW